MRSEGTKGAKRQSYGVTACTAFQPQECRQRATHGFQNTIIFRQGTFLTLSVHNWASSGENQQKSGQIQSTIHGRVHAHGLESLSQKDMSLCLNTFLTKSQQSDQNALKGNCSETLRSSAQRMRSFCWIVQSDLICISDQQAVRGW